jgi:hypothetical protein
LLLSKEVVSFEKRNLPVKVAGSEKFYLGTCYVLQKDPDAPTEAPRRGGCGCQQCSVKKKRS